MTDLTVQEIMEMDEELIFDALVAKVERQAKEIERLRRIEKAARESHGDGSSQPWCSLCAALNEKEPDADA